MMIDACFDAESVSDATEVTNMIVASCARIPVQNNNVIMKYCLSKRCYDVQFSKVLYKIELWLSKKICFQFHSN